MKISQFCVSISEEYYNYIIHSSNYFDKINSTYLLKIDNDMFIILEKVVYDITMFHLNQLNIPFDNNIHFIEFGINNIYEPNFKLNQYIDQNEDVCCPLFSSIFYLTEETEKNDMMIFSNLSENNYLYKEFDDIELCIAVPKKSRQFVFDGGKYYYSSKLLENKVLTVNVWNKYPNKRIYFDKTSFNNIMFKNTNNIIYNKPELFSLNDNLLTIEKVDMIPQTIYAKDIISDDFLEEIIYDGVIDEKQNHIYNKLMELNKDNESIIKFKKNIIRINIRELKYIQRPIIQNKFQKEICDWIICESEQYANNINWKELTNGIKIIDIENVMRIFYYILNSFNDIANTISTYYSITTDDYIFNIENSFICKIIPDSNDTVNDLFYNTESYDIMINIALNDDYDNGGKLFSDGIITSLSKGDMIIFNGNTKYTELKITKGIKYILIIYINVIKN